MQAQDSKPVEKKYSAQVKYYRKNREAVLKKLKERNDKRKADKDYYCEKCNKSYTDNHNLQKHLRGNRHKKKGHFTLHSCESCKYSTTKRQDFNKHLNTIRHRNASNTDPQEIKK